MWLNKKQIILVHKISHNRVGNFFKPTSTYTTIHLFPHRVKKLN
jgi:hypothetical protein